MLGLVSYKKKYKNTAAYQNLELQKMHKYYDEVLAPKVDAAFEEAKSRLYPKEVVFNLSWMLDTEPINETN